MPAKRERDTPGIILASILIVVAGFFLNDARTLSDPDSYVFPMAICVVMIVLCIAFIVWNLLHPHKDVEAGAGEGSTPRRVGLEQVLFEMLTGRFNSPAAPRDTLDDAIGFLPAGFGVFAALMALAMFEPWTVKRVLTYGLICVAIVSGFYLVFDVLFLVPLPEIPF